MTRAPLRPGPVPKASSKPCARPVRPARARARTQQARRGRASRPSPAYGPQSTLAVPGLARRLHPPGQRQRQRLSRRPALHWAEPRRPRRARAASGRAATTRSVRSSSSIAPAAPSGRDPTVSTVLVGGSIAIFEAPVQHQVVTSMQSCVIHHRVARPDALALSADPVTR